MVDDNINNGSNSTNFSDLRKRIHRDPMTPEEEKNYETLRRKQQELANDTGEELSDADVAVEDIQDDDGTELAVIPEESDTPVFLLDDQPEGTSNWIKWALMHNMSEEELVAAGRNAGSVRICAQELEKDGYRQRPTKITKQQAGLAVRPAQKVSKVFSGGSPPEALLEAIQLPVGGLQAEIFESGFKSGISTIILAVRIVQELSTIGVQQSKPVLEMAKSMREGEALAAKAAASDAAQSAAIKVGAMVGADIDELKGAVSSLKAGSGSSADPLRDMMVRNMEPLFQKMMSSFMPGLQPPQQGQQSQNSGWTTVQE